MVSKYNSVDRRWMLIMKTTLVSLLLVPTVVASATGEDPEAIIRGFVEDFARDPFASELIFGFDVDGQRWHMRVSSDRSGQVESTLLPGFPDEPILYWELSMDTLQRIDQGMNGETATARAKADDPYPLRTRATEGFPRYLVNQDLNDFLEKLRLHFWTKGQPEVFPLGKAYARESHGGNVVGLVYTEGLRTMWFQIEPGQHVNQDPEDQVNPSHSLFIVTKGRAAAKLDGKQMILEAGNAYLIPGGMSHEVWNEFDEPLEGVLVMYGEGA